MQPLIYLFLPGVTGWDIGLLVGFLGLLVVVGLVYAYLVGVMIMSDVEDDNDERKT